MPEPAASRQTRPRFQPAPSPAHWYGRPISVWPASSGNGRTPHSTPTPGPPRHPELDEASRNVLRTAVPMLLHKPVGQLEPKKPGWPDSWSSPAAAGAQAQSYRDRARLPSQPAASSGGRSLVASQLVGQLVARFTDAGLPRPRSGQYVEPCSLSKAAAFLPRKSSCSWRYIRRLILINFKVRCRDARWRAPVSTMACGED